MLRAVRRCWAIALLMVLLTACGGVGQPEPYDATGIDGLVVPTPTPEPADYVEEVDNPWLSLPTGGPRSYTVSEGGAEVGSWVVSVDPDAEQVAGIAATVVRSQLQMGSQPVRESIDYLAQDAGGNVWWLGHDGPAGSWRVGPGIPAGLYLPASPRLGDGWVSAQTAQGTVITRVLGRVAVEQWSDAVETVVESGTDQGRYYVSGVGLVRLVDLDSAVVYDLAG